MSDNWVVQNLQNALDTWNEKLVEIWQLITQSPEKFKGGTIWSVIVDIHGAVQAIGLALLVLFFVVGVVKTCGSFAEVKKPEHAVKLFIRFALTGGFSDYIFIPQSLPSPSPPLRASRNVGKSFIKSYAAVCLEGAIIVLGCIIFSFFAASPPVVDPDAAAVSMVWCYIRELVFNMLVLVGAVKMADRVVCETMGLITFTKSC